MGMISATLQTAKELLGYIGEGRKVFRRCIILAMASTILLYIVPYICGKFLDDILKPDVAMDLPTALDICTAILLMVMIWYVSATESKSRMTKMALSVTRRMREDMNRKMMKVPISYLDKTSSGDLTSRFTVDLPLVSELISSDYVGFVVHLTMIPAILIMMMFTSPILAVLYLLMIPVILFSVRWLTRESEGDFKVQKEKVAELNSTMSDIIRTHDTIRMENLEDDVLDTFRETNSDFTKAFVSSQTKVGMISPIISVIVNSGYFMVVVIGAILMMNSMLDVGMFLTFMTYVRVVNTPLLMTAKVYDKIRDETISLSRVLEVIDAPEEENEYVPDAQITKGEIRVEDLSFSYIQGQEVLHHLSFGLEPGRITAIVGPTASGKTTIANLIMGFYRPDSGRITIDGHDVSEIPRQVVSDNIGMVLQDPWIFEGTIRENILYNRCNISEEYMLQIAEMTGLDDFVRRLPDGYDTRIGPDRRRLPPAQRRMLALARTFVGNPKIIILDEAVAGLDPITGQRILRSLRDRILDCTVVIISHNQALIDQADRIIRLDEGRLVSDTAA